jgi:type I restriction enzyme S subunit
MIWTSVEIGDLVEDGVADIQTGPFGTQLKASEYIEQGVPVINVRNIGYSELRPEKIEFISDSKSEKLSVHKLEKSDIVFGRKGAVDRHLFVQESQMGWVQGSDCIRLRFDSTDINPRFISYSFLSSYHKQWMLNQCGNKATMASLNQDVVKRIKLKLPSKTHQDIIVDMLACYDDLIENNKRRIELLEGSARQLYKEWFVRFRFPGHEHVKIISGVPEGWKEVKVKDAVLRIPAGKRYSQKTSLKEGAVPILDQGQVGTLGYHDEKPSVCASYEKPVIVFSNHTCYQRVIHYPFSTIQNVLPFIPSENVPNELYWLHYATLGLVTLNGYKGHWPEFEAKAFLSPPSVLAKSFSLYVRPIQNQIRKLEEQISALSKARDLLLPKLMNGEIAV